MISDTILFVFKKELSYNKPIRVDAKLAITIDNDDAIQIHVKETFTTEKTDSSTITEEKQEEVKAKISTQLWWNCENLINIKQDLRVQGSITVALDNDNGFGFDINRALRDSAHPPSR